MNGKGAFWQFALPCSLPATKQTLYIKHNIDKGAGNDNGVSMVSGLYRALSSLCNAGHHRRSGCMSFIADNGVATGPLPKPAHSI